MCAATFVWPTTLSMDAKARATFLELFLGGILMLFLDLKALGTVGMLMALRARRQHRAVLASLGRVMGLPWAAILLVFFLGLGGALGSIEAGQFFAGWFALGIVNDQLIRRGARFTLREGFRHCLIEPNSPPDQARPGFPGFSVAPIRA